MIKVDIPGKGELQLKHLVLDYNGTLACDGNVLPGVKEKLNLLAEQLSVYIITADTFGKCREQCSGIKAEIKILKKPLGAREKEEFVISLGSGNVVAIGNGSNDGLMLAKAALGIIVLGPEGAAVKALQQADVLVKDINDGLDLLLYPKRLVATLRE
ncbi:HAD family hydrolase [Zhaonella formicivorans]|uniref:HAD family hydrolase n=1 Tax=Zhaonella formicivorans TaxID=2528593 RepID=UPI0010D0CEA1|nr:ATPase P [Zhaonella formicivorans]